MKTKSLNLYGYSERGMVNALCYEMSYSTDGLRLLREFLNLFSFPYSKPSFEDVHSAAFIVEQSFSDFGDLDLLILLDGKIKQAVLLEAKVKTSQANDWSVASQWAAFCEVPKAVAKTSNLFMQLYRKMRLIRAIRFPNEELAYSERMPKTSLGQNTVVKEAVKRLKEYSSETWFVSLIPGDDATARTVFRTEVSKPLGELPDWNPEKMGFLTWGTLERYCHAHQTEWPHTLATFQYNRTQIHGVTQQNNAGKCPPPGSLVTWNSGTAEYSVVVKNRGRHNTRVILSSGASQRVPISQLRW